MGKFFYLLIFILVFTNCKKHSSNSSYKNKIGKSLSSQWFNSQELENLAKCSNEGIDMMYIRNDTLEIISGYKLIYEPFLGKINSITSFKKRYGNIFSEIKKIEKDTNGNEFEITLLKYKNSYIKLLKNKFIPSNAEELAEYHYEMPDSIVIYSAKIVDTEIVLTYDIKIGMSKKDFFKRIFENCDTKILQNINIVTNIDFRGEFLQETFIFNNDTLSTILME